MPNAFVLAVLTTILISAHPQLCRSSLLVRRVQVHHPLLCADLGLRTGRAIGAVLAYQSSPFRPWSTGPPDDALNCR